MSSDLLMSHPDGSGRLIPHALYVTLKPQYEARHAAFEAYFGTPEEREGAREALNVARMAQEPVYKVEATDTGSSSNAPPTMTPVSMFGGLPVDR